MTTTLPSGHKRIDHVEMRGISKRFPGVQANQNVNFDVKAGGSRSNSTPPPTRWRTESA
jgi:hypothetical protein